MLNADDFFQQYPPYRQEFELRKVLGPVLYSVAKEFTDQAFQRLLSRPAGQNHTVVFTAGGGASGKSTVLRGQADRSGVDFVVDTTFSDPKRATNQVATALKAGRGVEVNYVYRAFEDCIRGMLERALNPKNGRVVPIDDLARTHWGAQKSVIEVSAAYSSQERVSIRLWKNVGHNHVREMSDATFQRLQHPPVDELQVRGQTALNAIYENKDRKWKTGPIPLALYEEASSKAWKTSAGR